VAGPGPLLLRLERKDVAGRRGIAFDVAAAQPGIRLSVVVDPRAYAFLGHRSESLPGYRGEPIGLGAVLLTVKVVDRPGQR
jgi:hypothetical protein